MSSGFTFTTLYDRNIETIVLVMLKNLISQCGRLNNGPQRCSHPNPQSPSVTFFLLGKGDFTDVTKLRILKWGLILDNLGYSNVITKVHVRGI